MKNSYVYLVGAGPGDEDLITIKGLNCIKAADVILYDRLANPNLLKHAKATAVLIDVGKSPNNHQYSQEEINQLLVDMAKTNGVVTRLKGGDPYVFGRGGEEVIKLKEASIPFEVVPGITSAISVPSYAGIPVTHRGLSTSFHVITGNEDPTKAESSVNYEALAKLSGTLVFLMGMANLEDIAKQLIQFGKAANTPAAIIHRGTTGRQRVVTGTLETIVEVATKNEIKAPSIIIVGAVVGLRDSLNWFEGLPLFGKRILVTRTRQQAGALTKELKALGAEVIEYPTIEIVPPEDFTNIDNTLRALHPFNYTIFTSVNGVKAFFDRLRHLKIDIRDMGLSKIIAIGTATAEALEEKGLRVEYIPEVFTAEGILEGLQWVIKKGDSVLLPRADIARKNLVEGLIQLGAEVEELEMYRTILPIHKKEELGEMLQEGIDIITFTSSSTVTNFIEILGKENISALEISKIAVIGPITAETARKAGLNVAIEAKQYTIEGLVEGIREGL